MGPYHKGETCDGNISGIKVVLDILVYVGISFVCAERCFEPRGSQSKGLHSTSRVQGVVDAIDERWPRKRTKAKSQQLEDPQGEKWKERKQVRVKEGRNN